MMQAIARAEPRARLRAGAVAGLKLGLLGDVFWPAYIAGYLKLGLTRSGVLDILRIMVALPIAGTLAGTVVAAMLPRLIRARAAWGTAGVAALTFAAAAFGVGGVDSATPGVVIVLLIVFTVATGFGVAVVRDLLFFGPADQERIAPAWGGPEAPKRSPALHPLVSLLDRRRAARRAEVMARPFPRAWSKILERAVPLIAHLPIEKRRRLEGMTQVFLAEKHFEGCGGLELTDEIRITIAAQACLLEIGCEAAYFPNVLSVLVYPSTFVTRRPDFVLRDCLTPAEPRVLLGESWKAGAVIIAWDAAQAGAADMFDGQNVVMHEFAHQLDQESGAADGMPLLEGRTSLRVWSRVMKHHLEELRGALDEGHDTVLDAYGGTNEAEFFAVATETFFEKPRDLAERHPVLFEQLRAFYQQDPREYQPPVPEAAG